MNYSQDVGGGSVPNGTSYSLCRIPLRWMVRECFKAKTGILFISVRLPGIGLDPSSMLPPAIDNLRPQPLVVDPRPYQKPFSLVQRWLRWEKEKEKEQEKGPIMMVSEEHEDLHDALSPIHDQLKLRRGWWIVELLPITFKHRHIKDDGVLRRRRWILDHLPKSFKLLHREDDRVMHLRYVCSRSRFLDGR